MILVDTNVWSVLTKAKQEPRPSAWIAANEPALWLSPLVVAEIRYGLELPGAEHKREVLERWLDELEDTYRDRTLAFDNDAGHVLGLLLLRKPPDAKLLDTLLAAQALSRDWPVATRNRKDFVWTGVAVIDPWTP